MAGRVVSAQLVVAKMDSGAPVYFYRGDVLPDGVSKESIEHLDRRGMLAKDADEFTVQPDDAGTTPAESSDGDSDAPGGNASLEDWQAFARFQGATDDDLDGKSRNDLRDEFGK